MNFLSGLKSRLIRTHNALAARVESALGSASREETLEGLEEALILADVGQAAASEIVDGLRRDLGKWDVASVRTRLAESLARILKEVEAPLSIGPAPHIIMVLGVNGVGKTTTIGKLAARLAKEKKSVLLGAGDTFRAAAIEQLELWAKRTGADIIKHEHGSDPGAVAFDSVKAALARRSDVVILDTAGRLHTKTNLMEELKKIRRVIQREVPAAPHESLLVLDATTGQNAISQTRIFSEAAGVTGIALTKLDGTAKGGIIVALAREFRIPVRLIGVGEGPDDLRDFNAEEFVEALI